MTIELTEKQQHLRDKLEKVFKEIRTLMNSSDSGRWNRIQVLVDQGAKLAHELHNDLTKHGNEPQHHKYMIQNRGVPPSHPDFYQHYHPIEDLLAFVDDPTQFNKPKNETIGEEFTFEVFTRRWGSRSTYWLTRIESGWNVRHMAINGPSDKTRHPILFMNFRQDSVQYPVDFGGWLEWLWSQAREQGLSKEEVQQGLDDLSKWLEKVERSVPSGDFWDGYA